MTTDEDGRMRDALSPGWFALLLFVSVVVVALLVELPLATIVGRPVSVSDALWNGVFAGGVFSVIYLLGTVLTEYLGAAE